MRRSVQVVASAFLSATIGGYATPCAAQRDGVVSVRMQARAGFTSGSMTVAPGLQRMGPPVAGEPYSVELESEHTQTLANGTHIDQKREISHSYRDSQGRTRTERFLLFPPEGVGLEQRPRLIQIYDPVEGYSYTLDTQTHVAHRVAMQTLPAISTTESGQAQADPTRMRAKSGPPGGRTAASTGNPRRPDMKWEPLGTEMIDGVQAEGTRTTITTPVGMVGNDRPLTRVCENWHSPELKITILSKCSDVRSGHSTIRLKNLDRSEPDAALFQVPADYTIVDEKDRFTMNFNER